MCSAFIPCACGRWICSRIDHAYARLQERDEGQHIHDILVTGVTTRKYGRVLPPIAGTVGIAKSSVPRGSVVQSRRVLEALAARRWDDMEFLVVCLDGLVVSEHRFLATMGGDDQRRRLGNDRTRDFGCRTAFWWEEYSCLASRPTERPFEDLFDRRL